MLGRRCLSHPLFSTTIASLNGLAAIHLWLRSASPLKATEERLDAPARQDGGVLLLQSAIRGKRSRAQRSR
jgi:hypothetical protein